MKVIFLKDIKGIGRKYEEKNVADGFALNSLIPKKLAVPSNGAAAAQIKHLKENELKHKNAENSKLASSIESLAGAEINFVSNANEKNHLFASITKEKICEIIKKERGVHIGIEYIFLSSPIKELGTYKILIKASDSKESHLTLIVKSK